MWTWAREYEAQAEEVIQEVCAAALPQAQPVTVEPQICRGRGLGRGRGRLPEVQAAAAAASALGAAPHKYITRTKQGKVRWILEHHQADWSSLGEEKPFQPHSQYF
eukprot:1032591-Rhodomonas_salina.1